MALPIFQRREGCCEGRGATVGLEKARRWGQMVWSQSMGKFKGRTYNHTNTVFANATTRDLSSQRTRRKLDPQTGFLDECCFQHEVPKVREQVCSVVPGMQ